MLVPKMGMQNNASNLSRVLCSTESLFPPKSSSGRYWESSAVAVGFVRVGKPHRMILFNQCEEHRIGGCDKREFHAETGN